jgi:hypothetical protein
MHDENSMIEAIAFMFVNPSSSQEYIGPVSVLWESAKLDYYKESDYLRHFVEWSLRFVCESFNVICNLIIARYKYLPREELLKFGKPKMKEASIVGTDQNRLNK